MGQLMAVVLHMQGHFRTLLPWIERATEPSNLRILPLKFSQRNFSSPGTLLESLSRYQSFHYCNCVPRAQLVALQG